MTDDVVEQVETALRETPLICQRHNAPEDSGVCDPECPGLWKHEPDYPRMAHRALRAVEPVVSEAIEILREAIGWTGWPAKSEKSQREVEALDARIVAVVRRLRALRPKEEDRD